jgi:hypothetical protein
MVAAERKDEMTEKGMDLAPAPKAVGGMGFRAGTGMTVDTFDNAWRLAQAFASSELVPKMYQGKPENALVAMTMGAELGLKPLQALQNIAVINGKPGIYGDAGKAILLANGCTIEEDDGETIKARGVARCTITRPGHAPCSRTFSMENARTAKLIGKEGPWTLYPERQMAWRAFWFAARDVAADLLKGFSGFEEIRDVPPEREIGSGSAIPAAPLRGTSALQARLGVSSASPDVEQVAVAVGVDARIVEDAEPPAQHVPSPEAAEVPATLPSVPEPAHQPDLISGSGDENLIEDCLIALSEAKTMDEIKEIWEESIPKHLLDHPRIVSAIALAKSKMPAAKRKAS